MDESVGDEGPEYKVHHFIPEYKVHHFICEACAELQRVKRGERKDRDVQGEQGDDLLDGRYWVAIPEPDAGGR